MRRLQRRHDFYATPPEGARYARMPPDNRLPPMPTGRASEEPPTQFDQAIPMGWLPEEPVPTSRRPVSATQRMEVALPQPPHAAPRAPASGAAKQPKPELSATTRVIAAGCIGFILGMAVTATMAMTIRPAPPPCAEAPR